MASIPAAICGKCNREMRCDKIGVTLEMQTSWNPATARPYFLIQADLYKCPVCGATVYCEFANGGTMHHDPDFERKQAHAPDRIKVS